MTRTPADIFWQHSLPMPGDDDALRELREVASHWESTGNYLGAGVAMERAARAAWGNLDQLSSCISAALENYERCFAVEGCPVGGFIALKKAAQLYWMPSNAQRRSTDDLLGVLADRLEVCSENSTQVESYLVRGIVVETDFDQRFDLLYPDYDVDWAAETAGGGVAQVRIPSAFQLFITLGDYHSAHRIAQRFPSAFSSDSLQGWRAAVRGLTGAGNAATDFEAAAEAFACDRQPELDKLRFGRSWSSINVDLWSPYFRSRSVMARAIDEPQRVRELVAQAASVAPEVGSGWHHPTVTRYVILVNALASLLRDGSLLTLQQAREAISAEQRLSGAQPEDELITRFLAIASESFEGFQANPEQEMSSGRLGDSLLILGRIPMVEPGFAEAFAPALGSAAINVLQGPVRTRMYRALEAIRDERQLQHVVLRLAQASLPAFAQVLHGPLEYGKDVVVLLNQDGQYILRMFQVKVGDISVPTWRSTRQQLEDMFLVPLSDFMLGAEDSPSREGVLICNGHALPNAMPLMEGWFAEQLRDHGRRVKFMHLDSMIRWIQDDHLVNEFWAVLEELGIEE